jgi:CRP-like cAMP-binding protein
MRQLPAFRPVTTSKIKAMISQFTTVTKSRGSYLFHENDLANRVYIINEGDFKIIKRVYKEKQAFDMNADAIFKDPLKVKR